MKKRRQWLTSNVPSKEGFGSLDDNAGTFYDSMVKYLLQTKNARDAAVKLISWLLDKILRTKNGKRKLDTFRVNDKPIVETKQQCCAHLSPEPNFTVDGVSFNVSQIWIVLNHIFVCYLHLFKNVTFEGFLRDVAQKQQMSREKKEKRRRKESKETVSTSDTIMTLATKTPRPLPEQLKQCSGSVSRKRKKVSNEANKMLVAPTISSRQSMHPIEEHLLPSPCLVLKKLKLSIPYILN